jgi:hypothetical protein
MKQDLILSLQGLWYVRHGAAWTVSTERPHLAEPCRILTDFDGAPGGVMTIDSKPDFAAAVIEKRLRAEGLVDGEARVLTHRVIPTGGGCRVLYTAVPVPSWQSMFAWLANETVIGLAFSVDAAINALAQRHDAVLCRTGRQFQFLVSRENSLVYVTATAFTDDPDDLDSAMLNLVNQIGDRWQPHGEQVSVLWCDLLASEEVDDAQMVASFGRRLNARIERAPVTRVRTAKGSLRTAADVMAQAVSWTAANNPLRDRMAAAADQFRMPIAAVTALFGLGLFAVAAFWSSQSLQLQERAQQDRQAAADIDRRNAGLDLPADRLLAKYAETYKFLDGLEATAQSPDLFRFLTDARRAASQRVRVMRIRLASADGAFRIDGVPANDISADRALSGFLAELRSSGYQVSAEDPGNQSQQPGFFSYSVRRLPDGANQ